MKIAVIGTGWIVQSFIDGLIFAPGLEPYAVYSRSRERGKEFAELNGIGTVFTSLDELAASPAECVYIASPNALHYEQSRRMLEAGKHVICEKPITVTPEELEELYALAEKNRLVYIEAIMYMHTPARQALTDALGRIGNICAAHFDFSQYSSKYPAYKLGELPNIFNPEMATGSLMDLGIYCVYPAVDLFGEPDEISAMSTFLDSGADALTTATLRCGNTVVSMTSCKTGQDYAGSQIVGEEGSIRIGSISKLTESELIMNSGERELICGIMPKAELMGNEARAFFELITEPEKNAQRYAELRESALAVSRTMKKIRDAAGITFGDYGKKMR